MKRILTVGVALFVVVMNVVAQGQTLFDDNWQFTRNGKTITVNLPHDWDIYEGPNPATGATGTGGGWFPGGKGEYRKKFKTPMADVVKLHFEGVYQKAEVYINGQKAGQHAYGYTPFTVDITPYLKLKNEELNEVLVKVNNSEQPNCRWYSGSGIYRHVWLVTKKQRYIDEWSVRVSTSDIHTVEIKAEVVMENGTRKPIEKTIHVENPHLWSPDDPYLYHTTLEAEGDVVPVTYGIFGREGLCSQRQAATHQRCLLAPRRRCAGRNGFRCGRDSQGQADEGGWL